MIDPQGNAAGRFELEGGPDGASCLPTTKTAQVTISVQALSSALLGGAQLPLFARAGLLDAPDTAALATLDTMLAGPVTPWCSTWF